MAKAKKKRKITPHMKKFGTVAKAANVVCHRETNSVSAYKSCMSTNMKAGLRKAGITGKAKKKAPASRCTGIVKSGPRKGRLKKGYTRAGVAKGRCPRKKAA